MYLREVRSEDVKCVLPPVAGTCCHGNDHFEFYLRREYFYRLMEKDVHNKASAP